MEVEDVFRTKSNIYGGASDYFLKTAPSQMFDWVLNTTLKVATICGNFSQSRIEIWLLYGAGITLHQHPKTGIYGFRKYINIDECVP